MYFRINDYRDHDFGGVAQALMKEGYVMTLFLYVGREFFLAIVDLNGESCQEFEVRTFQLDKKEVVWNLKNETVVDDKKNIMFSFIKTIRKNCKKIEGADLPIENINVYFNYNQEQALDDINEKMENML
jgi:hypothetical protein